jgi:hypothetical protein
MLTRLTHAGVAFAATAAVYQAYVLAVTPFVEPAGMAVRESRVLTPSDLAQPPASLLKYGELLAAYFPPDHWCFARPPKIVENGQAMVVFDEYAQSDSGVLSVPKCAIIFFPTVRDRSAAPPRDAIVLEPSQGATLQMNRRLSNGLGGLGRMQFGQLLGGIAIHSDMREPGPQDDLLIETKDIYMNEDVIQTPELVEFRLGEHHGQGRGLEIRFYQTESSPTSAPATLFGKLESLEISQNVAARIAPGTLTLFGSEHNPDETEPRRNSNARDRLIEAPAQIDADGPFRIDFSNHVAAFSDNVRLRQLHPDGKLDRLLCQELILYFAELRQWGGEEAADGVTPVSTDRSLFDAIKLEPATVEARGAPGHPLTLEAPSQDASASGDRLTIELIARQVTLAGEQDVALQYHGAEIHAPSVRYELPPKNSPARLGAMAARGGGWLRATPDPNRPDEVVEVRWTDAMQLVRRGGQPVLVLDGRPRVEMLGVGRLWANQLELCLREGASGGAAIAAPAPSAGGLDSLGSISVERIVAKGSVNIESPEIVGDVNTLDVKVVYPAADDGAMGVGGPSAATSSLLGRRRGATARRTYHITGSVLEIDAVVRDRRPDVAALHVDGGVEFRELDIGVGSEPSLEISAERLHVTGADGPNAIIEVLGAAADGGPPGGVLSGLAEITARGTMLRAPALTLYRGTSRAEINSPGEIQMMLSQDAMGQPLAEPQPVAITWRHSMTLDGNHLTFRGKVFVQHARGWLEAPRLEAWFTAPVRFDGATRQRRPELEKIACFEGVKTEFDQRDDAGVVTAHQRIRIEPAGSEVPSLSVNQLTGEIFGEGPGRVDSVHYSADADELLALPIGSASRSDSGEPASAGGAAPPNEPKLRRLTIEFARGVRGNLNSRWIELYGSVRTVYAPVRAWDERIEMTPGGRPGPDAVWITCDKLKVAESPLARLRRTPRGEKPKPFGQVELSAEGSVVIEANHPDEGAIIARGHRATYDQMKSMFVLEWDGRTLATITVQKYPGAQPSETRAQTIIYRLDTGAVKFVSPGPTRYIDSRP